ncbi:MAG TPA: VOC family protein [Patescibacteria group bacterium]|nr:VOC family protein [Patescibacteria group bacterium]
MNKQNITPFFWFEDQAEEAANYYVSFFPNSKINNIVKYPEAAEEVSGKKAGSVMTVDFTLNGMDFAALNGGNPGPGFSLASSSAISFVVNCETQEEIDMYWGKLSAVPEAEQCGWCKDRFGITWQIVPTVLNELLAGPKAEAVTACFIKMKKFDIATLKEAAK